jgi:hydroxymethylbilane synthase
VVTEGDRNRNVQLDQMAGIGIFVRELEEALLNNRIDLAVHSLKDMPMEIPQKLCLCAVTERADARDVLVSGSGGLDKLPPGSRIGTSSFRRAIQVTSYRPDLKMCSIRGNIDTRLRKVSHGEVDGIILAAAALLRLGWENQVSEYLPVDHFLPAIGQGTLAIESRIADEETNKLITVINHLPTWQSITAERAFLAALGGGCRAPIAALGTVNGTTLELKGMVADTGGQRILYNHEEGNTAEPENLGERLAQKILNQGASEFIMELRTGEKG